MEQVKSKAPKGCILAYRITSPPQTQNLQQRQDNETNTTFTKETTYKREMKDTKGIIKLISR